MTSALLALAAETKAKGWWHAYGDTLPAWFELYVGMESTASRLRHWEPDSLPGLLQTRAYADHLLRSHPGLAEREVGRLVELRMERQKILMRKSPAPPRLEVIVDEGVLRRPFPGMADHLGHLHNQAMAEVPFGQGGQPAPRWRNRGHAATETDRVGSVKDVETTGRGVRARGAATETDRVGSVKVVPPLVELAGVTGPQRRPTALGR